MKLEAKIYLWRKSGEWEKTSGLVSCLLSCFPCCFSSCLLLFFKHSNWSVLSVPKSFKNQCSLAEFIPKHSFQNQYLREHFLKNSPLSFHKTSTFPTPVPNKNTENLPVESQLSAPAAPLPFAKFYQGPPCVSCNKAGSPWPRLHALGLLLMVLGW